MECLYCGEMRSPESETSDCLPEYCSASCQEDHKLDFGTETCSVCGILLALAVSSVEEDVCADCYCNNTVKSVLTKIESDVPF